MYVGWLCESFMTSGCRDLSTMSQFPFSLRREITFQVSWGTFAEDAMSGSSVIARGNLWKFNYLQRKIYDSKSNHTKLGYMVAISSVLD